MQYASGERVAQVTKVQGPLYFSNHVGENVETRQLLRVREYVRDEVALAD